MGEVTTIVSTTTLPVYGSTEFTEQEKEYLIDWLTNWYEKYQDQSGKTEYLTASLDELKVIANPKFAALVTGTALEKTSETSNFVTVETNSGASSSNLMDKTVNIMGVDIPLIVIGGITLVGIFALTGKEKG